jgi:hypothetical protein
MDAAEREAVALAQTIYPGLLVYTDNKQAGGTLIPREQNGNAHRTASMRKNFIERKLIEAWMRNPERPFHIQFDIKEVT